MTAEPFAVNGEQRGSVDWPGCLHAVVVALTCSWISSYFGFGAAGVLLLVVLLGTACFAVINQRARVLKSALFGGVMVVWNVVENDPDILFDSDLYTLVLPLFPGFPLLVAVIAEAVVRHSRRR